jgi:hypothetical protein
MWLTSVSLMYQRCLMEDSLRFSIGERQAINSIAAPTATMRSIGSDESVQHCRRKAWLERQRVSAMRRF